MTVGIVVVSHSPDLARAALALAEVMLTDVRPAVAIAAGASDGSFGTDATAVMAAIEEVRGPDGTVVLVDMGSSVLSAETAVDLLAFDDVRVLAAPFVEGLTAGLVRAATGGNLDEVAEAAETALDAKFAALGREPASAPRDETLVHASASAAVRLVNAVGLHARPAARLAQLASRFDAELTVTLAGKPAVNARSTMSLMALGAQLGDELRIDAEGAQADEALRAVVDFVAGGLGDEPVPSATD